MQRPPALDAPREFRINEMFFSTTDAKGRILSGNDVFVRVSGYERTALIRQAHNIIRHPDMPRVVFRLVWDFLQRGLPVAGLIKNLASDGRYYWVLAFLMPVKGGYLSIRFKPSSRFLPVVEDLYRRTCECEREQEVAGVEGRAAMDASEKVLVDALTTLGFAGYDAFMRTLLHDELKCRDAAVRAERLELFPPTLPGGVAGDPQLDALRGIYLESLKAYQEINTVYAQLDDLAVLNQDLGVKSDVVLQQTKDFRFIAFNAALRAARLGEEARSLGVIADYLGDASGRTGTIVAALGERVGAISTKLRFVTFNLAAARLQIEMILSFCAELAVSLVKGQESTAGVPADVRRKMIEDLQLAFAGTVEASVHALTGLGSELLNLGAHSEELRKTVLTLQVAQVGGLVEATRVKDDDSFVVMFGDLREGIERTKSALAELDDISDRLQAVARNTPVMAAVISASVDRMSRDVHALTDLATAKAPALASVHHHATEPELAAV